MHYLYTAVSPSVTDGILINELNKSIATGPLYVNTILKIFESSYLMMWRFKT